MATVTIAWDVQSQSFPAGTAPGNVNVSISGGALTAPLTMSVAASPAVFLDVPDDDADPTTNNYTATVQRTDNAGNPLGAAASVNFSVTNPPPVAVDIPVNPIVTVS